MTTINITNLRKDLYEYVNQTIEFGDVVTVNTKNGNAVILAEEEYNGLLETLYLKSIPGMEQSLLAGRGEPLENMTDAEDLEW